MAITVWDRVVGYLNPAAGMRRVAARRQLDRAVNEYDAASDKRGNRWVRRGNGSARAEVGRALPKLRATARELVRNNAYAHRAIEVIVANTVGAGITPSMAGERSASSLKRANRPLLAWGKTTRCDRRGLHNLAGLQALAMRALMESGEALIVRRLVDDKTLDIPLQIEVLEGDYLDHTRNETVSDGEIVQGVQFDSAGTILGYWLYPDHPGNGAGSYQTSRFVPADQVVHLFEVLRPGQVRGVPRGVAAFNRVRQIDTYQDARVAQQQVAACFGGFIREPGDGAEDKDSALLPERLEPGLLARLAPGEDISFATPPTTSGHTEFLRAELQAVAIAYGVTYESLTGDLSGVNFSSGRMGWLEFQRNIDRWLWTLFIPRFLERLGEWIVQASLLGSNPALFRGLSIEWTPPPREMIDPAKEIRAMGEAIRLGLKTRSACHRELGEDPQAVLDEFKRDNEDADSRGLIFDSDPRRVTKSGGSNDPSATDPGLQRPGEPDAAGA